MILKEEVARINEEIQTLNKMDSLAPGKISDGYHTFDELYHHRAFLFAAICNTHPDIAWKSKFHDDGTMYPSMFIVGIETEYGQATYHYDITYWEHFKVKELDRAPVFDGHTPEDAINRIHMTIGYQHGVRKGCSFSDALSDCKMGARIYREHWKEFDPSCFIVYQKGYPFGISCNEQTAKAWRIPAGSTFKCEPYLQIAINGTHEMYTPGNGDIMANDWVIDWE